MYVKGRRKEYKIVARERALGRLVLRSAGSHSPIDVVSIDYEKRIIKLIQSKPASMSKTAKEKIQRSLNKLNDFFLVDFVVE